MEPRTPVCVWFFLETVRINRNQVNWSYSFSCKSKSCLSHVPPIAKWHGCWFSHGVLLLFLQSNFLSWRHLWQFMLPHLCLQAGSDGAERVSHTKLHVPGAQAGQLQWHQSDYLDPNSEVIPCILSSPFLRDRPGWAPGSLCCWASQKCLWGLVLSLHLYLSSADVNSSRQGMANPWSHKHWRSSWDEVVDI